MDEDRAQGVRDKVWATTTNEVTRIKLELDAKPMRPIDTATARRPAILSAKVTVPRYPQTLQNIDTTTPSLVMLSWN